MNLHYAESTPVSQADTRLQLLRFVAPEKWSRLAATEEMHSSLSRKQVIREESHSAVQFVLYSVHCIVCTVAEAGH